MRELLHAARNFGLPWVDVKLVNLRREFRASINAGEDGSIVVGKVLEKEQYGYGFDAQTGEYGNLVPRASSTRPRLYVWLSRTQLRLQRF